ncbi:HAMP domain-containing sensor histidine kinase [Asanoa sp. WMMD1127]|uniref:HAMP domain-containing sensor histidine kinase n=1 Tax=Asanoa sp. WMMD1127 TaxID=3016107 RepID=UPI002417E66B|nr:HAMP domain-containing sensor histidine kinase [Asanoa sp. WMMD1127]MDG4824933.1 HAMP domain-containing sensor histidine kinase [Asanoa sp. WMMD1127]
MTAGFAAGALLLSACLALASYELIRTSLIQERERTAVRAAYFNATIVNSGISGDQPDLLAVLRSLDTGSARRPVLRRDGRWYARGADSGVTDAIPTGLREVVEGGRPAVQRIQAADGPALVVGVPLAEGTAFYQVDSLTELAGTVRTLGVVLLLVALATTAAGAAVGWYATRRVLRPLAQVTRAARDIARGDLSARLDAASDPDLISLTSSFNDMVGELSHRLERDRRFAADVAHELRSPLQTLAASASVLTRRRDGLDARTATAASLVAAEIQRFQALVNDLLHLARSDQPAQREHVAVAELARNVCRSRRLPDELVTLVDGTAEQWHVDRSRFQQLLGNLLDNAVQHGGGPVAVRLGAAGDICYLEVDDEGPGVRAEDREMVFARFVRGWAATARGDSEGTGLGLALVAQHAAAHQGQAVILDRPGGGARFRVELAGCLR